MFLREERYRWYRINQHHFYTGWITDTLKLNLPPEASHSWGEREGCPCWSWNSGINKCPKVSIAGENPTYLRNDALNTTVILFPLALVGGLNCFTDQTSFMQVHTYSCTTGAMMQYRVAPGIVTLWLHTATVSAFTACITTCSPSFFHKKWTF